MKFQNLDPVNGRAVKGSDLVASQQYIRDTATANRSFQTQSMDSISSPDDNTVVIKLKKPNAYLLTGTQLGEVANWSIIPQETLAVLDNHQSIGSGPYQEVTNDVGVRADYKRYDGFRAADKTYIDNRSVILFGDSVGYSSAFISGQLQIFQPQPSDPAVDDIVSQVGKKVTKQTYPTLAPYTVNIGGSFDFNPLKKDIRARQAFYRAIKRQQYIDLQFNGKGTVPTGLLVDGLSSYLLDGKDTAQFFKEDVAEAKQLFEAAGVTGQEYQIMYFAPSDVSSQTCQILQTQLKAAGINTTINGVPTSQGFDLATKGQWQLFGGGHPSYDSPQTIMRQQATESGSRFGHTGLEDPESTHWSRSRKRQRTCRKTSAWSSSYRCSVCRSTRATTC
jgi:peptide/nickel transport system substrate-binding protein